MRKLRVESGSRQPGLPAGELQCCGEQSMHESLSDGLLHSVHKVPLGQRWCLAFAL